MELTISNRNRKIKVTLLAALIGFGASFLTAPFVLNAVHGLVAEVNTSVSIGLGLSIPINANNSQVDNYIENVKEDICKTLVNSTEFEECMKI